MKPIDVLLNKLEELIMPKCEDSFESAYRWFFNSDPFTDNGFERTAACIGLWDEGFKKRVIDEHPEIEDRYNSLLKKREAK